MNSSNRFSPTTICQQKNSVGNSLLIWLLAIFLPILAAKVTITYFSNLDIQNQNIEIFQAQQKELEEFKKDLNLTNFLEKKIKSRLQQAFQFFQNKEKAPFKPYFSPLLFAFLEVKSGNVLSAYSKKYFSKTTAPSRSTLKRILDTLEKKDRGKITNSGKLRLLKQICKPIFGNDFSLFEKSGKLYSGYTNKFKGDKIFAFRQTLSIAGKKYFFLLTFIEAEVSLKPFLIETKNNNKNKKISRGYSISRSHSDFVFQETSKNFIRLSDLLPESILKMGIHKSKDITTIGLKNGSLLQKPQKMPMCFVQMRKSSESLNSSFLPTILNLILLLIAFSGIALIKISQSKFILKISIRQKFFFSIFLFCLLPFGVFIAVSRNFSNYFLQLKSNIKLKQLQQSSKLLEMKIQSFDSVLKKKSGKIKIATLSHLDDSQESISSFLENQVGKALEGYFFIRSDGVLLENLCIKSQLSERDRKTLFLFKSTLLAQAYKVLQQSGLTDSSAIDKIKRLPGGRNIVALGELVSNDSLNSFCNQEGYLFSTPNTDNKNFRLSVCNFLFKEEKHRKHSGFLFLIFNYQKLIREFIESDPKIQESLLQRLDGNLVQNCIFEFSPDNKEIVYFWPPALSNEKSLQFAAERLKNGNDFKSWSEKADSNTTKLFSVHQVSNTTMRIVTFSLESSSSMEIAITWVGFPIFVMIILGLIAFLSMQLATYYIEPISLLLDGVKEIRKGHFPKLVFDGNGDFSDLISSFNTMIKGFEERQKLNRFVSTEAAETISAEICNSESVQPRKTQRTIGFTHINNFIQMSKELEPEQTIRILNKYFSELEPIIINNNGVIDKYLSDAIMFSFKGETQFFDACRTAVLIKQKEKELKIQIEKDTGFSFNIGVGISSGNVISGKIGNKAGRKDFTLIGDAVNLAARLESLSRSKCNFQAVVSEATFKLVEEQFNFSFFEELQVKGKTIPVKTYILLGESNPC